MPSTWSLSLHDAILLNAAYKRNGSVPRSQELAKLYTVLHKLLILQCVFGHTNFTSEAHQNYVVHFYKRTTLKNRGNLQ